MTARQRGSRPLAPANRNERPSVIGPERFRPGSKSGAYPFGGDGKPSRFPECHRPTRSFCLRVSGAVAPSAFVCRRISPAGDHLMAATERLSADCGVAADHKGERSQVNAISVLVGFAESHRTVPTGAG